MRSPWPNGPEVAEPREHGQALAADEHVDQRRSARPRSPRCAARASAARPTPAPTPAPSTADEQREQHERMEEESAAAVSASAQIAPTLARVACRGLARRR